MTDLHIIDVPVESLIPYARNARTHSDAQIAQIAASIREFGFTNPVLVDGARGIIAGHGRVLAARKLQMAAVPCIELGHLTDTQRRAYILADNKLAENARWDMDMLRLELEGLKGLELDGFTGFNPHEIDILLQDVSAVEFKEYDESVAADVKTVTCPECGHDFPP
jgi:ParB-like chromosome segregation protein Spo0J